MDQEIDGTEDEKQTHPEICSTFGIKSLMHTYSHSVFLSPTIQECGIPKHFGLFYAMGTALMMEGLLSACYHVCPNYTNFQFGKCASIPTSISCVICRILLATTNSLMWNFFSVTQLSVGSLKTFLLMLRQLQPLIDTVIEEACREMVLYLRGKRFSFSVLCEGNC